MANLKATVEDLENQKYIKAAIKTGTTNVPEGYESETFSDGSVWFIEADVEES